MIKLNKCLRKFCYLNSKVRLRQNFDFLEDQENCVNVNILESSEQLNELGHKLLTKEQIKQISQHEKISNYPIFGENLDYFTVVKNEDKIDKKTDQLKAQIKFGLSQAKNYKKENLNLNIFLEDTEANLNSIYLANYFNFHITKKDKNSSTQKIKNLTLNFTSQSLP